MKRVLCFGDSLTWGWVPVDGGGVPTRRYPRDVRWTGVLADRLGDDYDVIEEGLNARTTTADDPFDPRLNGSAYLPTCLASHLPLDLGILMLGTNDAVRYLDLTAVDIARGMGVLVTQVLTSAGGVGNVYPAPKTLVVAPPPLGDVAHPWFKLTFDGAHEKIAQLPEAYRALASFLQVEFFDAGTVVTTTGVDGIHLTEEGNRDLGAALADRVAQLV
jgi:lysophospholipase L1-like esterase